ncbi:MAG: thioredoxin domain-containing protein [Gemmatimonadaceae bacterium]
MSAAFSLLALAACGESAPRSLAESAVVRAPADTSTQPIAPTITTDSVVRPSAAPAVTAAPPASAKPPRDVPRAPASARVRRIVFGGVDFTGIGHDRGSQSAPVVLIDMSDFACPYCAEFSLKTYPALDREYVRTGKVLFKYIPFVVGSFRHGEQATRAAECAADQGQFWLMLERIYSTQTEWKRGNAIDAQMVALAGTTPVDSARFSACYSERRTVARTERANELVNSIGLRVTPSFLVNGHPVQGALPLADFRKQIETALLVERSKQ